MMINIYDSVYDIIYERRYCNMMVFPLYTLSISASGAYQDNQTDKHQVNQTPKMAPLRLRKHQELDTGYLPGNMGHWNYLYLPYFPIKPIQILVRIVKHLDPRCFSVKFMIQIMN